MWKFFGKTDKQRIEERELELRLEKARRNRERLEEETLMDRQCQDPEVGPEVIQLLKSPRPEISLREASSKRECQKVTAPRRQDIMRLFTVLKVVRPFIPLHILCKVLICRRIVVNTTSVWHKRA